MPERGSTCPDGAIPLLPRSHHADLPQVGATADLRAAEGIDLVHLRDLFVVPGNLLRRAVVEQRTPRDEVIGDGRGEQIGVAAAVAIPVLACVNAELIVFCKVSSDAPAVISDPGGDVLV